MAKKHFENIIGKIIYGTLLFMPLLNVLGTSIYAIANKNAYESYYGDTINEVSYTKLTDATNMKLNTVYHLQYDNDNLISAQTSVFSITNLNNFYISSSASETTNINTYKELYTQMYTYPIADTTYFQIVLVSSNTSISGNKYLQKNANNVIEFDFEIVNTSSNISNLTSILFDISYNNYSFLDNAFEFGIYKTENSPYYNWTTNTAINDVIHQTTTTLGINNTFVDLLLTYWLLMTIIYVIYDLGLMLIQIAHKKVHKICDKD